MTAPQEQGVLSSPPASMACHRQCMKAWDPVTGKAVSKMYARASFIEPFKVSLNRPVVSLADSGLGMLRQRKATTAHATAPGRPVCSALCACDKLPLWG